MKKTQFGDLVITSNPFGKVAFREGFFSNEPFLVLSGGTVANMINTFSMQNKTNAKAKVTI